ncbi:DUF1322 family protein [Borrelia duttonii]|uniref:Uncharacterized conserved protein n=1 Tax=Borrelia duttonii (strain Ly) TaxID=412419 RepID=B5RNQ8_BORDL|nr:uncharacterized conserved protein [Borrelia duttonii Ly]ACH94065.1 uncharacterized conserved protein [Borrelia duttonii Ly]
MKINKRSDILEEITHSYFKFLENAKKDKYHFPVMMDICSFDEVKTLNYKDLMEVNKISDLKLQMKIYEMSLSRGIL